MSSNGGVQGHAGGGVPIPPEFAGKDADKVGKADKSGATATVGRGFSNDNSVSFHQDGRGAKIAPGNDRTIRLPKPQVDPASVVTPDLQAQLALPQGSHELLTAFEDLINQAAEETSEEGGEEDSSLKGLLYGASRKGTRNAGQQGQGEQSYSSGGSGNDELAAMLLGSLNNVKSVEDVNKVFQLQTEAFDVLDHVNNIKSGPPAQVAELKEAGDRLNQAMLSGDIEDIARLLSEVQTKIQDTRIKFDEQAIQTSRLKREMLHGERIGKLKESLAKIREANKAGLLGKIFGAIATAFAVIVAAVTIATGVGAAAGIALIAAATIMVTMTISQNTGGWMSSLGGLIKDENIQMAIGIGWAVLAAVLSLGAGVGPAIKKKVVDIAGRLAQKGVKVGSEAAKQGAKAAAQTAQQSAGNAAQQSVQQASTAARETAKSTAKVVTDAADDAAREAAKQIADKTRFYRRAAMITRFAEGGTRVAEGGAQIHSSRVRHEGEMYQASALEDLAYMTKLQLQMEDWMEAIQKALQEISEGQVMASDMLAQAQNSKFTIARNI